jgi:hypothetical protein
MRFLLLGLLVSSKITYAELPKIIINGPSMAKENDLIIFNASESEGTEFVAWRVEPFNEDLYYIDSNKLTLILRPKPGNYVLFIAISNMEGLATKSWYFTITPKDGSDPDPGPDPEPPRPEGLGLIKIISDAVRKEVTPDKFYLLKDVASIYRTVANGSYTNVNQMVTDTRNKTQNALGDNRDVWIPIVKDYLGPKLNELGKDKKLETIEQNKKAWIEIAKGIEEVVK